MFLMEIFLLFGGFFFVFLGNVYLDFLMLFICLIGVMGLCKECCDLLFNKMIYVIIMNVDCNM